MACMIEFSCVQQDLKRVDEKTVAEGASVVSAKFELCDKWDGLTVYARFRHGASCFDVALAEGVALIPWEVLRPTGFEVSVWGEDGEGGKLTSASLFVDVARTVSLDAFEPIPSSPTLIGAFTEKAAAAAEAARIAQEANAATVAIGTVETGAAGTDASVTNSGTGMSAVFDFVIPRGEKGETGDGLPEGGEVGQVVTLSESGAVWADPQGGGSVDIDFPITVAQGGTGATSAAAAIVSLGAAAAEHDHDAGDIASGTLSVERGGTGAATAETARASLSVYSKAEVDALTGGGGSSDSVELVAKAGIIQPYGGDALPDGFLWCDGAAVSRSVYAELFAAIGTTFGVGDGSTTFNVPDLCGRVPVGAGDGYSVGATGGEAEHTLTVEEMPSHEHAVRTGSATVATGVYAFYDHIVSTSDVASGYRYVEMMDYEGGDQAHNNMQPYTVTNYIISTGKGSFTEVVAVGNGGTGASTAAGALDNLGLGKVLFSGNLNKGETVTIEGISKYRQLQITTSDVVLLVGGIKASETTYVRAWAEYPGGSNTNIYGYFVSLRLSALSSDEITFSNKILRTVKEDGTVTVNTSPSFTISEIRGIV